MRGKVRLVLGLAIAISDFIDILVWFEAFDPS